MIINAVNPNPIIKKLNQEIVTETKPTTPAPSGTTVATPNPETKLSFQGADSFVKKPAQELLAKKGLTLGNFLKAFYSTHSPEVNVKFDNVIADSLRKALETFSQGSNEILKSALRKIVVTQSQAKANINNAVNNCLQEFSAAFPQKSSAELNANLQKFAKTQQPNAGLTFSEKKALVKRFYYEMTGATRLTSKFDSEGHLAQKGFRDAVIDEYPFALKKHIDMLESSNRPFEMELRETMIAKRDIAPEELKVGDLVDII